MRLLDYWKKNRSRFRAVLLDIDGTIIYGPRLLPGALEFLAELRDSGIPYFFLTNDGNHPLERKAHFLQRVGIEASPEEILSCIGALPMVVEENGWVGQRFLQVGEIGTIHNNNLLLETDVEKASECEGILLSEGVYDWRVGWEAAINALRERPQLPVVVPNPDVYWPSSVRDNAIGIGAGGQAHCLALLLRFMGFRIRPTFLGKPYAPTYRRVKHILQECLGERIDPETIFCVGDSLASDIRGANRAGMHSALVLTGITTPLQAMAATGEFRPNEVFDVIGD